VESTQGRMDTLTPGTPGRQWEPGTVNRRRTQKMLEKFGRKPFGDTTAKVGALRCGGLRARERGVSGQHGAARRAALRAAAARGPTHGHRFLPGPLSARCVSGRRDRHPRRGLTCTSPSATRSLTSSTTGRKRRGAPPPRLLCVCVTCVCRATSRSLVRSFWAASRGPSSNCGEHGLGRGAGNNPGLGSAHRGYDTPNTPFVSSSCVCERAHAICLRARVCAAFGKRVEKNA
jgi:hypothetical protein